MQLHKIGIAPLDVASRNVLVDEQNEYRVIDLANAELNHECHWSYGFEVHVKEDASLPLEGTGGCANLSAMLQDMEYWECASSCCLCTRFLY